MGLNESIRRTVRNAKRAVIVMDRVAQAFVELRHRSIADAIRLGYRAIAGRVHDEPADAEQE